jgi:hypothetical protein
MNGAPSGPQWRQRVVSADSIARLALNHAGGHVAATRVLYDGMFKSGADATGLAYESPDRAVLVVTVEHDGRCVGVAALADRSGRVFSDDEVTLAEGVTRAGARRIVGERSNEAAQAVVERMLQLLGGETAALYTLADDGAQLALVAAR